MTAASPSLGRGGSSVTASRLADGARPLLPVAAAAGAGVLALTSTGSMVVAAALLGVAVGDRRSLIAVFLAVAAVAVRFATTSFDDLAGIQSVLGSAVEVGPATGAASAWAAAAAVVLAAAPLRPGSAVAGVSAVAAGAFAAAIAAGQGPGGELWVRVGATVLATAVAGAVVATDRAVGGWHRMRPWLALAIGVLGVVLAAWR